MSKFHAIYGKGGDTPGGDTPGGDTYGTIEFNWSVSSSTNASEPIALNNTYTAPLDGYYKRSEITGFTSASSNLTTEFAYKKAGDTITLNVSKSEGVQKPCNMTIYYSSKGGN